MVSKDLRLDELRNDQILPYFWEIRRNTLGPEEKCFRFLDLNALKTQLKNTPAALSDLELEAKLYGSEKNPHYSGWTRPRIQAILDESGFEVVRYGSSDPASNLVDVYAVAKPWPLLDRKKATTARNKQKIWAFRKNIRAKAEELASRARSIGTRPIMHRQNSGLVWLNLGAGKEKYTGYLKIDLSGQQDIYDNIVTLKKLTTGCADKIYTNHVLEHIPQSKIDEMLRRWFQVLKVGGVVIARAPDAKQSILHLNEHWRETTEERLYELGVPNYLEREKVREGTLDDDACIQCVYGWSDSAPHLWDMPNQHKSLWTPDLARQRFAAAGFSVELAENLGSLNTVIVARKLKR